VAAPVGIGLRAPHYRELARERAPLGFLEVHSENFMGEGGPALAWLEHFRRDYPLSLHGVGMSLGSADPLDEAHLARLASLVRRMQPMLVSEHLCWSSIDGRHAHDLLPLPFTTEVAAHLAARIARVQDRLGRAILVENVSSYVTFAESTLAEAQFICEVARRAGCKLLLDVNNVYVNSHNQGFDAGAYLEAIDPQWVGQIHLGGHAQSGTLLVDTHGTRVCEPVWALYRAALRRFGPRATLVEWDADLPGLDVLLDEARLARACLAQAEALIAQALPA
jgi:uncharacterized protein (UPF0276 family)